MEAKEIAEKYVYGKHYAFTNRQEIIDMERDIKDFAKSKKPVLRSLDNFLWFVTGMFTSIVMIFIIFKIVGV